MKAIGYVMKAIGYGRVSTDRQAEQGVSLEAQEAKIRAMATFRALIYSRSSSTAGNRPRT
jgi:DNA invertase Pin-like site-specific DNA recombinase